MKIQAACPCLLSSLLVSLLVAAPLYSQTGVTTVQPEATGTISFFTNTGLLQRSPVGDSIQSTYFRTSPTNAEIRRGALEFSAPLLDAPFHKAWLILQEWRGISGSPTPPAQHQLSYYEADRAVDTNDYSRPASPLTTFATDENEDPRQFAWDVTPALASLAGKRIGFRIQLLDEASINGSGGTGFLENSLETATPRLVILTATDPAVFSRSMIVLQSPLAGQNLLSPAAIPLNATAIDPSGYIKQVEFYANGTFIGASPAYSNVAFPNGAPVLHRLNWHGMPPGAYSIVARGMDSMGATIESLPLQFTISSNAPVTGVITRNIPPGFSLLSNPTLTPDRRAAALFEGITDLPNGFGIYFLDPDGYKQITFDAAAHVFEPANLAARPLLPGTGVWVYNPSTNSLGLTISGEIQTASASSELPTGLSIAAPILGTGTPASQDFPGEPGDIVYFFNPTSRQFVVSGFDPIELAWLPPLPAVDAGSAFLVRKQRPAIWNHRRASNGFAGRADTSNRNDLFGEESFEWYEYFGGKSLQAGDQVTLSFSLIPARLGVTTYVGLDALSGNTFFGLNFNNGTLHEQLPYHSDIWNRVTVTFRGGASTYTLDLNGQILENLPFNSPATSMAAFRLNLGDAGKNKATAWIDDVAITVNGARVLQVDFDATQASVGGNGFQGTLTPAPRP